MKRMLLAVGVLLCLGSAPALAWELGSGPEYNRTNEERKIVRVFRQMKNGVEDFAAFILSVPGGTTVSTDVIMVHDLSSATSKALYTQLTEVYAKGQLIVNLRNNSRETDRGTGITWFGAGTFYRVYANDYYWIWLR